MPKKNILEFTIKEFEEYDKKLKELRNKYSDNISDKNYLFWNYTKPKVPLMYQGDIYRCLCDYEYKTKNHAGISRTCPSCKSTNVENVSHNKRMDGYKIRLKEYEEKLKEIKVLEKENEKIKKQIESTKKILDKIKESKKYQNERKQEAIERRNKEIAHEKLIIEEKKRREKLEKERLDNLLKADKKRLAKIKKENERLQKEKNKLKKEKKILEICYVPSLFIFFIMFLHFIDMTIYDNVNANKKVLGYIIYTLLWIYARDRYKKVERKLENPNYKIIPNNIFNYYLDLIKRLRMKKSFWLHFLIWALGWSAVSYILTPEYYLDKSGNYVIKSFTEAIGVAISYTYYIGYPIFAIYKEVSAKKIFGYTFIITFILFVLI